MEPEDGISMCSEAENIANLQASLQVLQSKYEKECAVRRDLLNQLTEVKGNIRVLGRVRPLSESEDSSPLECSDDWTIHAPLSSLPLSSSTSVPVLSSSTSAPTLSAMLPSAQSLSSSASSSSLLNKKYQFDRVFGPSSTQSDVFEEVSTLSTSLLDGFDCCLFAYGQTGSGKTFTMEGPSHDRGLNYRLLRSIFSEASQRNVNQNVTFEFHTSVMEIYNEAILDLLDQSSNQAKFGASIAAGGLKLRQGERGICVPDATRIRTHTLEQVEEIMEIAKKVRAVASTDMNEHSSRSHCVTCFEVCGRRSSNTSANQGMATGANSASISASSTQSSSTANSMSSEAGDTVTHSRLFLIDLAGSERIAQSGAQGKALEEAKHINKSLSALARVMECLQLKRQHIPFRDSTLTHLLKDALVDAKTVMVLNLSPAASSYGQSVNSLNFGVRVRKIERSAAKKNIDIDRDRYNAEKVELEKEVAHLKAEVAKLSSQLASSRNDTSSELKSIQAKHAESMASLRQQHAAEMERLSTAHEQEVAALKKALAESNASLASATANANSVKTIPRPIPVTQIAASIVSGKSVSISTTTKSTQVHTITQKENVAEPVNQDANNRSAKDKYIHQTTPIKPKVISNVLLALTPGGNAGLGQATPIAAAKTQAAKSLPLAYTESPSSKLSSPMVVVDELQKLYLKQQQQTGEGMFSPASSLLQSNLTLNTATPMVDENGILIPVVMTPQIQKKTVIATASPLDFAGFNSAVVSKSLFASQPTASIFDDEFVETSTSPVPVLSQVIEAPQSISPEPTLSAPSTAPITTASSITSTASSTLSLVQTPAIPTTLVARTTAPISATSSVVSATASLSISTMLKTVFPLKGCLIDRSIVDRAKKNVSFNESLEVFGGGDPLLPIRRTTVPQIAASSAAQAKPSSSAPVRPSPASPIKSVAVRPVAPTPVAATSSLPGARRVVSKATTSATAPKPTPARVRPVGRTAQPLTGPASVYKTY